MVEEPRRLDMQWLAATPCRYCSTPLYMALTVEDIGLDNA